MIFDEVKPSPQVVVSAVVDCGLGEVVFDEVIPAPSLMSAEVNRGIRVHLPASKSKDLECVYV